MRAVLTLAIIGFMTAAIVAADSPFTLPALAPPATAPVDLDSLEGYQPSDVESVLTYFRKHQSVLSDDDRVKILSSTLLLREDPDFGAPNFWKSGPPRPLLEFTLKAARGAENERTLRLRRLRIHLAGAVSPYVKLREAADFALFLRDTDFDAAPILLPTPTENDDSWRRLEERLQRQRLIKYLALHESDWKEAFDQQVRSIFEPPFRSEAEGPLSTKTLDEVIAWLDKHDVPRLASVPLHSPHDVSQTTNSKTYSSLAQFHARHVEEFIGSASFGIARNSPKDTRHYFIDGNQVTWKTTESALLSFLDRPEPRAYGQRRGPSKPFGYTIDMDLASDPTLDLPRSADEHVSPAMAALKNDNRLAHRTRKLTEVESEALESSLSTLKPTIIKQGTRIDMVAPILAQARCLRCHDVELGEALGALSYVLAPQPPTP